MKYYVDTCIILDLLKMEQGPGKKPWWKIAEEFFEEKQFLYTSKITLRELQINPPFEGYAMAEEFVKKGFGLIDVASEDKAQARELEAECGFSISYYDLCHLLIAKRLGLVLVTRDKKLIQIARREGVVADYPEQL